jgi:putative ABC transport system permease protein
MVRASTTPETLMPSIRAIIRQVDPALPISDVSTLTDVVDRDTASRAVQVRVLGAFAAIAFVLAGIGIHGLLSFAVSQRTQEIGVRMALGAQSGDILSMVLRRTVLLAPAGGSRCRAGLRAGAGWGAAGGRQTADRRPLISAAALVVVVTSPATSPALRALRVSPMTAIRANRASDTHAAGGHEASNLAVADWC